MAHTQTVAIAADHAGMPLRADAARIVEECGFEALVLEGQGGTADDYPDIADLVCAAINDGRATRGILLCGSGAGVTVAANKWPLVRAALAHEPYTGAQMVEHDACNVLTMGARVVGSELAAATVRAFAQATFSGVDRHARRLGKVLAIEGRRNVNAPKQLHDVGQSLWLDNIHKDLITEGTLARYISELSVTGLTSNPSILDKAIAHGDQYDEALRALLASGVTDPEALAFALALDDLTAAADLFRGIHDATGAVDGYVSVEVSPTLADDTRGTIEAGRRLYAQADRPNVLIKVPGTAAGLPAITELIGSGIPVNVTLLFSADQYRAAADAYMAGIERLVQDGKDPKVGSVASVFVSRWDKAADPQVPDELVGHLGLAVMQDTLAHHHDVLESSRWKALADKGAIPQRLLFASTSTKNPALPDTYYLGRLAAPGTVDTVPEDTLLAFADHGAVCDLMEPDHEHARGVLKQISDAGVDVVALGEKLQVDGAAAFVESWKSLLASIEDKVGALAPVGGE